MLDLAAVYSERLQNIARKGEMAALPRAGHSARFSISGRHSAIEKGTFNYDLDWPHYQRPMS